MSQVGQSEADDNSFYLLQPENDRQSLGNTTLFLFFPNLS